MLIALSKLLTWDSEAVAGLLVAIERPRTPPISLLILCSSISISQLILFTHCRSRFRLKDVLAALGLLAALGAVVLMLFAPLRSPRLPKYRICPTFQTPTSHLRSPEDNLTLLQFLTVSWMGPLISIDAARPLQDEDDRRLDSEFTHW